MRSALRGSLVCICVAMLGLAACDPPPAVDPVGAAVVEPDAPREPLPEAVSATVHKLREIAVSGSYRDLAKLANATPGFRSNNGGMTHQEYWYLKLRTGDWPMAQVEKLLGYHYAVADSPIGKVYVWPWMSRLKPDEITPAAARDIDRLLGAGEAEQLKQGKPWPGYVLGIAEDGTWLYFVSGSG